jgi:hypothetical protein
VRAGDVIASAGTRKRLGQVLGELCGWLWPEDCQTCGQPLRGQPALCVDDFDAFAFASLHHPRCRRAEWNDSGNMTAIPGSNVSWTCQAWTNLPFIYGDTGENMQIPFFMVNPGLEMVFLARSDDGWQPELPKTFPEAGLQRPGRVIFDRPVPGLSASLSGRSVKVRQLGPPFEVYGQQVDDAFVRQGRAAGGVMFGVTHLVNPAVPVTGDQMNMLILTGSILLGWVSLRA